MSTPLTAVGPSFCTYTKSERTLILASAHRSLFHLFFSHEGQAIQRAASSSILAAAHRSAGSQAAWAVSQHHQGPCVIAQARPPLRRVTVVRAFAWLAPYGGRLDTGATAIETLPAGPTDRLVHARDAGRSQRND